MTTPVPMTQPHWVDDDGPVPHATVSRGRARLLGEILSYRRPSAPGAAGDHYRWALALATDLGMRPLAAHCHLGLRKL